jgi:hypothetical protein
VGLSIIARYVDAPIKRNPSNHSLVDEILVSIDLLNIVTFSGIVKKTAISTRNGIITPDNIIVIRFIESP